MTIPAGWYDDGSGRRRWWDGSAWTQHTLAAPAAPVPARPEAHSGDATAVQPGASLESAASEPRAPEVPAEGIDPVAPVAFAPPWELPGTVSDQQTTGVADSTDLGGRDGSASAAWAASAVPQPGWGAPGGLAVGAAQPGWSQAADPGRRRGFPVLGVIALGLALLGAVLACVPAISVAGWALLGLGFVLGIVSLFLRAPKWPGIASLGVSALGGVLAAAVVLISLGSTGSTTPEAGGTPVVLPTTAPSDDDHAPVPEDAERVGWADLEVGQCIPYVDWEEDVYYVPVVSCDEPHTDEVYLTFDIEDGEFPGDEEVGLIADERCVAEFETFVGHAYADSVLDFYWSVPTQRTWRLGDREVVCIVYSYDDVTGTLQGAAR